GRPGAVHPLRRRARRSSGRTPRALPPTDRRPARSEQQYRPLARGHAARGAPVGRQPGADRARADLGTRARLPFDDHRLALGQPALGAALAAARLPSDLLQALPRAAMNRVPMLAGSRLTVVNAPADSVILRPLEPGEAIADVGAAVRDALRFPLAGEPLEALVPRGGSATVVVEPPALPVPGTPIDPRQSAIAATVGELERAGIPTERQTILVAGGLQRRAGRRVVAARDHCVAGLADRCRSRTRTLPAHARDRRVDRPDTSATQRCARRLSVRDGIARAHRPLAFALSLRRAARGLA